MGDVVGWVTVLEGECRQLGGGVEWGTLSVRGWCWIRDFVGWGLSSVGGWCCIGNVVFY